MATPTAVPEGCYADYGARHPDDRSQLFEAISGAVAADRVLYPGSYIDIASSFHFDDVTYVDTDRRAARFFAPRDAVTELIADQRNADDSSPPFRFAFHHLDDTADLPIPQESIDLLVSLDAGFVSEYCTRTSPSSSAAPTTIGCATTASTTT